MRVRKNRRKLINFSVKRQMQVRLLLKILLIISVSVGLMGVIFYLYSNREIASTYRQFHIQAKNFLDYLLPAVVGSLVIALISALAIGIFFPHRIAGPLYRIERDLKEKVGKGDLSIRFVLRKGDEVHDLAKAINTTLGMLGQKIKNIKEPVEKLDTLLSEEKDEIDYEKIRALVKEVKKATDEFKL
jgi:methyl-accepting chemotaxis protein